MIRCSSKILVIRMTFRFPAFKSMLIRGSGYLVCLVTALLIFYHIFNSFNLEFSLLFLYPILNPSSKFLHTSNPREIFYGFL